MAEIIITIKEENPAAIGAIKNALQNIATNFSKPNILYIADLSKKSNVNEKFESLKNNVFIKNLL